MKIKGIRNFSLSQLQNLNGLLYRKQNDCGCYDPPVMVSKMLDHAARISKAKRKNEIQDISYHVCMLFSWSLALANRFHLDMEKEVWARFPGICTYCVRSRCRCKKKRAKHRKQVPVDPRFRPSSCHGYQEMFAGIYPQTLAAATGHLSEEVIEVNGALRNYIGTHDRELFDQVVLELVDVVSMVFAVATNANLDLATEMKRWFKNGCPRCECAPCQCNYLDTVEERKPGKRRPKKR